MVLDSFWPLAQEHIDTSAVIAGQSLDICHQTLGLPLEAYQVVLAASPKTRRHVDAVIISTKTPKLNYPEQPWDYLSTPEILESAGLTEADVNDVPSFRLSTLKPPLIVTAMTDLNWPAVSTGQNLFDRALADGSLETSVEPAYINGLWPHEQYELLHAKQTKMITTLSLLAGAFSKLDTKWCSILVHRMPFLNPNLLSDVFATIDILSKALEAGHPLLVSLPCLRECLGNTRGSTAHPDPALLPTEPEDSSDDSDSDTHAEFVAGNVEGVSIGFEELSLSVLKLDGFCSWQRSEL
ncbi:hypothetical protein B0H13DRAFT_2400006 [Mycena leptocephala]|nr:hypothetical protein B0H13DRAFT_2400006 [Mycena leptocephala]